MRILRGKSNLEVSSQGFAWFVVGLVLATFLGGAVRTILSSERVHKRIVSELNQRLPKLKIQIEQTEVLLARGIWPGLGLRLKNVSFRQEGCGRLSYVAQIPDVILPLNLLSLRKGQWRVGVVQLNDPSLAVDYVSCVPSQAKPTTNENSVHVEEPSAPRPIDLDWRAWARHLDGVRIERLTATFDRAPEWKVNLPQLELELSDEARLEALAEVQRSLPFGAVTRPLEIEAHADQALLRWNLKSAFKEGYASVGGSLDLSSATAVFQGQLKQLPLKDLVLEAYQVGWLNREYALKASWLSCSLQWEGQLKSWTKMPVRLSDCRIEGGYGQLRLERADLWPGQNPMFKVPAEIRLERVQVQPVLEAAEQNVLPTVLSKLGVWTGQLRLNHTDQWLLEGDLEGSEILFSNRSVRGKQFVDRWRMQVEHQPDGMSVQVTDVVLQGGEFSGRLTAHLDRQLKNGTFKADIQRLRLAPGIQVLLIGGIIGPARLVGEGSLQSGQVSFWRGDLSVESLSGLGWEMAKLTAQSRFSPGVLRVDAKAQRMTVSESWFAFPQLKVLRGDFIQGVEWTDLRGEFDVQENGGVMRSLVGLEGIGRTPWRAQGAWVRDGALTGHLTLGASGRKIGVRGEKGLLILN